jgi:RNA polymerase sigma-70 factor (ECF subfamily)
MELEHVFRDHQKAVYVYFLRLVGDTHQAEELTQETFYRACLAALRFRGDSSVTTWLFGIAHRVFLEFLRARRTEAGGELPDLAALDTEPDTRIDLERAFAALSHGDREVLMLVDLLGFAGRDAAEALGIEQPALRVRVHRARARLREAMGHE